MYIVQQLQAADYLLKKLRFNNSLSFTNDLKLVIRLNNSFWYGDFIEVERTKAVQSEIREFPEVSKHYYSSSDVSPVEALRKISTAYSDNKNDFSPKPFINIDDLNLLFNELLKLLENSNILREDSPFFPYLLNATSLDGKQELPFINLGDDIVQLISLMEIKEYS